MRIAHQTVEIDQIHMRRSLSQPARAAIAPPHRNSEQDTTLLLVRAAVWMALHRQAIWP